MRHDDTLILNGADSMGRPPKEYKLGDPINIRFTQDQVKRLDKLLEDNRDHWASVGVYGRVQLIRYLVITALPKFEETMRALGSPKRKR
jgi:hypothetical protein